MRLLIKLRCTENIQYDNHYHYPLQGYIYNLLRGSKYDYVHDKEGYKFFCFSNIFPAFDLKKDDFRTLIISSPDSDFIQSLLENLNRHSDAEVRVGSMKFRLGDVKN
jgi:CRISPR-associated endoribonuclease Cas6